MDNLDPRVVERFREFEATLRGLWESNTHFNAKVHDFVEVADRIGRVEGTAAEADAAQELDSLRHRRAALEDELMAMIQQNVRV
ncbi:MAG: hypothetical protein MI920_03715 [Kiloniellales bacterium]|nr:hypothetical protein [Kiloniellales bacterium]